MTPPVTSDESAQTIRFVYRHAFAALTAALLLVLTACGSSATSTSTTSSSASAGSGSSSLSSSSGSSSASGSGGGDATSSTSQAARDAKAALEKQSQPAGAAAEPGPAINVKALVGKTVFYVPLILKASYFQLVEKSLKTAFDKAGVKMQSCDGQANPSGIGSCLDQAVTRKADAVITDYIPYELAPTAFEKVRNAGIPVYVGDEIAPAGVHGSATLAFNNPDSYQNATMEGIMNAVIADSGGKAHLLFLRTKDDAAVARAGDHAISYVKRACPMCVMTVQVGSISQMNTLPSLISSLLIKDPSINYVVPQYDSYLAPVITGIQSAGKTNGVKLASANASLANLPLVKTNPQVLAAVGHDSNYSAWSLADGALRLMGGQAPPAQYPVPVRAFTKANIGDLQLTAEQEGTGSWFGDASAYQKGFLKLWGVS